ncbi:hypothetical protein [Myroides odoratimimus]|uniref:hypothetical protein n=1 Tax=Myroides odoratimimus TaxID=76832 RepID=UPI0025773CCA|nr:hypothetical protein [Myroides odoratimimus]MDM1530146.1 hypothetical protein [Myroides odoratimimus]
MNSANVFEIINQSTKVTNLLTEVLRIEDFRGFSKAKGIEKYLRLRTTANWATSEKVTGLRPTFKQNVFFGDRVFNGKRSLLVFVFNDNQLKIDVYRSFYPCNQTIFNRIIEQY